jgi:putative oxidoreductase
MAAFMKPFAPQIYALMRIIFGLLFMSHGLSKLFGYPVAAPAMPAPLIYVAAGIELVGGALVAIGLLTRWAAFVCSGMMAAAYWMAHGMHAFHPLANHGETAVLYCFAFLFIAAHGPGIWSADR